MTVWKRLPLRALGLLTGLIGVSALYLAEPVFLHSLRNSLFDQYQRWQPRATSEPPAALVVVDIDEASLVQHGQWPWPRNVMARLVDELSRAGAAVVVFDVLFAEADRTSPLAFLSQHPLADELARQLAELPDPDLTFAAALARQPSVLGFSALRTPSDTPPLSRFAIQQRGGSALRFVPPFAGSISALPPLEQAAAGTGAMTFVPDTDGVVRRVPLFIRVGDNLLPSLTAEALRVFTRQPLYRLEVAQNAGIQQVGIGALALPTNRRGELWVHFRESPVQSVPAWQVLDRSAAPERIAGNIVLIGSSAQGLQDLRFSPLGGIIPGVQVHAQALEQALTGDFLQRPSWANALEALTLLFGSVLLCLLVMRTSAIVGATLATSALIALNVAAWWSFSRHGLLIDALTPSLCMLLIYLGTSIAHHRASERQQRWVRAAFSRYVSPNLVEHLVQHPDQLKLGGHRQHCSFIFTDLTGFTTLMEQQPPEQVVSLLNDYLEGIIQIAFRYEGTLDRIVGDALAVLFSAPLPQADHPSRALACALEIQRFAAEHAERTRAAGIPIGATRIGVHSGEVVIGNFGGKTLFDYRALGDAVNVAARLEGLNRHLGTTLCVSQAIHDANPDTPMRAVGEVILMGKLQPIAVYEPGVAADPRYQSAYRHLQTQSTEALAAFTALAQQRPDDGLVAFHLARLRRGEQGAVIRMADK
ncbi:CHASE2 domain-containing protein [Pseudomonas borbori]